MALPIQPTPDLDGESAERFYKIIEENEKKPKKKLVKPDLSRFKEMIREYDIVVSRTELPNVLAGTVGTVVHIHKGGRAFEVEFVNEDGSISVETVLPDQIEKGTGTGVDGR